MAAYGSGYYGAGNYSFGVSLGELNIVAASAVTAAGLRYAVGAFDVSASSVATALAVTVKDASFGVIASSASSVAGDRVADGAANIAGSSAVSASGLRVAIGAAAITNAYVATPYQAYGDAKLSTAQQKFGASSAVFDGAGDYIRSPNTVEPFENSDYTVEMWVRPNSSSSSSYIFDHRQGNGVSLRTSGTSLWVGIAGFIRINISSAFPVAQAWYHVAITRSGNSTKCFIDGVQKGSTYTGSYTASSANLFIGAPYFANSTFFNGYIDEFRVSSVARYTSNFTPSSSAFNYDLNTLVLLHFDGANNSTVITDSISPPAVMVNGLRYAEGAADVSSSSSLAVDGVRVAFVSATVASSTQITIDSTVVVNQSVSVEASSLMSVDSRNILDGAFNVLETTGFIVSGTLKWVLVPDTPESWQGATDTAEVWSIVADTPESWSVSADTPKDWAPVEDTSEIWQLAA